MAAIKNLSAPSRTGRIMVHPMSAEPHSSAPIRTAPLALWRVAEAFLRTLHMLYGAPENVAARHTLTAKAHAQMASWLRSAEAMLRRLLLIEAAACAKPTARPLLAPARKRVRRLMSFTAEHPEKWRVSLRVLSAPACGGGQRRRLSYDERWARDYLGTPATFRSAWPLAERYEALIRVFNDPAPYARRLSRRLHATPHRVHEALRAPREARDRVDRFAELGERARAHWRRRFSSA